MVIQKPALAGTLESSDVQIMVEPGEELNLTIQSNVIHQFGDQIKAVIMDTLSRLGVEKGTISVIDKGALDCTLKARLECAVYRSNGITENLPWGEAIR